MTIIETGPQSPAIARVGERERSGAGAVSILDTTELRWFNEGPLPTDVLSWFTDDGTRGAVERRCDTYRMDTRHNVGMKRRFRETLELKVRQSVGEQIELDEHLAGRLEVWRKWSPATALVDNNEYVRWTDVHKMVVKRRFDVAGHEVALSENTRPMTGVGCDVEVASVTVDGIEAWTFAFAAFGPNCDTALVAAWRALVADVRPPKQFGPFAGRASGYPEWLSLVSSTPPPVDP